MNPPQRGAFFSLALSWHVAASSPQYGENTAFFQFSLWRDPRLGHFAGYSLGASGEKHQPLSITQPSPYTCPIQGAAIRMPPAETPRHGMRLFSFPQYSEYIAFLPNFPSAGFMTDHLLGCSFGTSRKHQPLPVAEPNEKTPCSVEQGAQQIRVRQGYFARQAPCLLQ